jgi:hypothetical protein
MSGFDALIDAFKCTKVVPPLVIEFLQHGAGTRIISTFWSLFPYSWLEQAMLLNAQRDVCTN